MCDSYHAQKRRLYAASSTPSDDAEGLRRKLSRKLDELDDEASENRNLMNQTDGLFLEIQADMACASEEDTLRICQLRNAAFDSAQQLARQLRDEREDTAQKLHELDARER